MSWLMSNDRESAKSYQSYLFSHRMDDDDDNDESWTHNSGDSPQVGRNTQTRYPYKSS